MIRAALVAPVLVAWAGSAGAARPGVAIDSDEEATTISIPGAHDPGEITAAGDRIELRLEHDLAPQRLAPADGPVRRVYLTGDRLVLRIGHSQETTAILAAATQIEARGDALLVRIPRDRRAAAAMAAEPPAAPAVVAAPDPPVVAATTPTPAPPPAPPAPAPPPALAAPAAPAPPPPALAPPSPAFGLRSVAVGLLLVACAVCALVVRRRRHPAVKQKDGIEILASRSLGGKTRAVLVVVNNEKMLVAVNDRGAQLLGQWPENEFDAAEDTRQEPSPFAVASDTQQVKPVAAAVEEEPSRPELSAAVAGLIRLARAGRGEGKPS